MQEKLILLFVTSLLSFSTISCTNDSDSENCINPQFSISQSVDNEGFHRDINWLIESLNFNNENWNNSNCKISLQLDVPPGMFVNPDQISELVRVGQISAYIKGNVNIESPAHESTGHTVYIFVPDNNLEKIAIQLPIHLRYQRAVMAGGFGKVSLPMPSLLVYCTADGPQICDNYTKVFIPCDTTENSICTWQNVTYQALFSEVQLFVPIGDLNDYPLVSIVTLLLGCAGSIYILSLLSTTPL